MAAYAKLHYVTTRQPLEMQAKREYSRSNPAIPFGAKKAIIATTIVGGIMVLLLLLWAVLCRRRRLQPPPISYESLDRKMSKHRAHRQPAEMPALPLHMQSLPDGSSQDSLDRMPIRQMTQYPETSPLSVSLPKHISRASKASLRPAITTNQTLPSEPIPAHRSPKADEADANAFTLPPDIDRNRISSSDARLKRPMSNRQAWQSLVPSPGGMSPLNDEDTPDRWSWTNSEAPPTPRIYAPSVRGSGADFVWFRRKTPSSEEMRAYAEQKSRAKHLEPPMPSRKPSLRRMLLKDTTRRIAP